MTYEIKTTTIWKPEHRSNNVCKDSFLATSFEMTTKGGLNCIKALPVNKNRCKWVEIPNEYQMEKYYESFELTICEATTGKNIYKVVK